MEPTAWSTAGRALVAKMVAEWSYEDMLHPVPGNEPGQWSVELPGVSYRFRGRRGAFDSWIVDPASVTRIEQDLASPADDPVRFLLEARAVLGFDGVTTCEVVRELTATQHADTVVAARALAATATADLPYEALESHQGGHPCLVLNKGRLGFSAGDAARYAPEAAHPFRLLWIAVTPEMARTAGTDRTHPGLVAYELDPGTRDRFADRLRGSHGADDHVWLPVHPFHWDEAVATLLAADVATGRIVLLGESDDRYLPLQSIRTVTNIDHPERHDVKLPMLIRNTLVWRGLAPRPTHAAPAVTQWLQARLAGDAFLHDECRMVILGEVASASVRAFEEIPDAPYRYHELLGALWRQPVGQFLRTGERARTMASLLHVGPDGRALVAELVHRSGLDPRTWLRHFLQALLPPLLHWLYQYGVAFCPHGENTVLIFDPDDVPIAIAVKDLAEDVNLLPEALPEQGTLPLEVDGVLLRREPHDLRHSIVSAIFAGHFRFLAPLAEAHLGVPEPQFWQLVRAVVENHHRRFAEMSQRIERFGILDPVLERVCLNREQLTGGGFHDRVEKDESFDVTAGFVPNPLHVHA